MYTKLGRLKKMKRSRCAKFLKTEKGSPLNIMYGDRYLIMRYIVYFLHYILFLNMLKAQIQHPFKMNGTVKMTGSFPLITGGEQ